MDPGCLVQKTVMLGAGFQNPNVRGMLVCGVSIFDTPLKQPHNERTHGGRIYGVRSLYLLSKLLSEGILMADFPIVLDLVERMQTMFTYLSVGMFVCGPSACMVWFLSHVLC